MHARFQLPANRLVLLAVLLGQVATVAALVMISGQITSRAEAEHADALLAAAATESVDRLDAHIAPVELFVTFAASLGSDPGVTDDALSDAFLEALEVSPQLAGVYIASLDGDFNYVNRTEDGFRAKNIAVNGDARDTQLVFYDDDGRIQREETDPTDTYDPTARPWFIQAESSPRQLIWTEPYVFFTSRELGVTVATTVEREGRIIGVVGADIELGSLSEFLLSLPSSDLAGTVITNEAGTVIAHPDPAKIQAADGDGYRTVNIDELDDQFAIAAHNSRPAVPNMDEASITAFESPGNEGARAASRSIAIGDDLWSVSVFGEEKTIVGDLAEARTNERNVAVAVGAIALALFGWIAWRVTRPIQNLQRRARESEVALERVGRIIESSHNEVYMFDAETLQFSLVNQGARDNLGYAMEEMLALTPFDVAPDLPADAFRATLEQLRSQQAHTAVLRAIAHRKDGSTYPADCSLQYHGDESPPVFVAIVQDVTDREADQAELERHRNSLESSVALRTAELLAANEQLEREAIERRLLEAELQRQADHDRLTGLPNRHFLERLFPDALGQTDDGTRIALVFMDLNGFKYVNDTLGHPAGDKLLTEVSARLRELVRSRDTLVRLGGDEFALLIEDASDTTCHHVLERLKRAFQQPFVLDEHPFHIGMSMGVALSTERAEDNSFEELVRRADVAMYRSKKDGVAVSFYDTEADQRIQEWSWLERQLREAIDNDEFELRYQPILDLETKEIVAAEALLRWHHHDRGLVMPNDFIPVAEETGFIVAIDRWVLATAIRHAAQSSFAVAVNIAPRTLLSPGFVEHVRASLLAHELPAHQLHIEVTERALAHPETTQPVLVALADLGIKLGIDDFGTGYSSLTYLQHYPLSTLKLDQSFMEMLGSDEKAGSIAKAVIHLAHSLHLTVVAEGVETISQQQWLEENACDAAQGYLFAYPMPLAGFTHELDRQHRPKRHLKSLDSLLDGSAS